MKTKSKKKSVKIDYTSLPISQDLKRKLIIERAKNGYTNWESFLTAICKILKQFKPELEEFRK